jgi:hypothetical protein
VTRKRRDTKAVLDQNESLVGCATAGGTADSVRKIAPRRCARWTVLPRDFAHPTGSIRARRGLAPTTPASARTAGPDAPWRAVASPSATSGLLQRCLYRSEVLRRGPNDSRSARSLGFSCQCRARQQHCGCRRDGYKELTHGFSPVCGDSLGNLRARCNEKLAAASQSFDGCRRTMRADRRRQGYR